MKQGIFDKLTDDKLQQAVSRPSDRAPPLAVSYYPRDAVPHFPDGVLADIRFGTPTAARASNSESPRLDIDVALVPLRTDTPDVEIWHAQGPVRCGQDGAVRFAHDGQHLFACAEIDERDHGGILAATEFAYSEMRRFQSASQWPHVLRMWNYADAVNEGAGDMERYRQFCVGRARGLGDLLAETYPAASAVGRQYLTHVLQVYWLAGRVAGTAVENPRQVSAYRYPQTYGPSSPIFSRATIAPDNALLISGTASIIGHASQHIGDVTAQLDETLRNLDALIAQAARQRSGLATTLAPMTYLKVYVRDAVQLAQIDAHLHERRSDVTAIYLGADICRRELLLEIECIQTAV